MKLMTCMTCLIMKIFMLKTNIMKYTKKFESHSDYTTWKSSSNYAVPNVCYCASENEIHCTPEIREN